MRKGRDDALQLRKAEGEIIRMYSTPKIIASLDAKVVLTAALGHYDCGSQVYWNG
jgi:hypothetical protein